MKRFTSHLIFISPDKLQRRTVVELDDQKKISNIFQLDENNSEPSQTQFLDGIISSEFVSVKQFLSNENLIRIKKKYHYFDVSEEFVDIDINPSQKALLLDFGNNSYELINSKINRLYDSLKQFSISEIISSCTYLPALLTKNNSTIELNNKINLLQWNNTDLLNMRITNKTFVKLLA